MKRIKATDYDKVIENIFFKKYSENQKAGELDFTLRELELITSKLLAIREVSEFIKNIPDIIYTYRSRRSLPEKILKKGNWIIQPKGKGKYSFIKTKRYPFVEIQEGLASIDILNSLPEIVEQYIAGDEQGFLSSIRYNRLVDIFTDITCFHLQSHIRTTIAEEGQIEIDDLYVGVDQEGKRYILPLEAKGPDERDKLGWVQISNLVKYAKQNFPTLICRPIAAKPVSKTKICLVEFESETDFEEIGIRNIRVYHLVRRKRK
jgi:hypothetical protein